MRLCTKCGLFKPTTEFSKNSKSKAGLQRHCKVCKAEYQRLNPNRKAVVKKYYDENREVCVARAVASHRKKRAEYTKKAIQWQQDNRDRYLEARRGRYAANRAEEIERVRRRQGRIKNATINMCLAEKAEVDGMYEFCRIFSSFEVDHIVPLNGDTVSGLHVLANLQVLDKSLNRSKGNKFVPEAFA